MSFANRTDIPTVERTATAVRRVRETDGDDSAERTHGPPLTPSHEDAGDWSRIAAVGISLALGALIGAGVALFLTPLSGPTARRRVRLRTRRTRRLAGNAWDELGETLRSLRQR